MPESEDRFKDIRPYRNGEIRRALDRLLVSDGFCRSIARFHFPRLSRLLPGPMARLARRKLRARLAGARDVESLQDVVADYMDKEIRDTTSGLTSSGLENLSPDRAHLFISNHRDIAMDPAFVNYVLHRAGRKTAQIAIGDNLLKKPFVSDLMRLNKSFIVNRSLSGRELLKSLRLLSEYIHHCIDSGESVWIAQRQGRAKDSVDRTDPTLLKMLAMGRRELPLSQSLGRLGVVPVTISYEYDPCDLLKAEELRRVEETGGFVKTDESDMRSIAAGITGFKGRVHVAFGREIRAGDDADGTAALIDRQILANYVLADIHYLALERLGRDGTELPAEAERALAERTPSGRARRRFRRRIGKAPPALRRHLLRIYANPALGRLQAPPRPGASG